MKMQSRLSYLLLSFCLIMTMGIDVQAKDAKKDKNKDNKTKQEEMIENRLVIDSKKEFLEFAENCRLDRFSEDLIVSLEADIDLTGNKFDGIPIFGGMFEGNHHTISGLHITGDGSVKGLFRYLTEDAVVQNLSVKGNIEPHGSRSYVGSIAGNNAGTILNCNFTGEISGKDYIGGLVGINEVNGVIENCKAAGTIEGIHFVGGIAGENYGVIRDCSNETEVNTQVQKNNLEVSEITMKSLTSSEAAYTVTDIGGIVGSSSGVIKNCNNYGTIGYQHVGYNVGGIAGSQVGYVFECTNQGQVLGRKEVGGIVGQMEPVANLEFNADTLQILEGQLSSTAGRIKRSSDRMAAQMNQNSTDLQGQIDKLQLDLNNSGVAVEQLVKDLENAKNKKKEKEEKEEKKEEQSGNKSEWEIWYNRLSQWEDMSIPDTDSLLAARSSLNQSMTSMNNTLNSISASSQESFNTLSDEVQGIMNQAKSITSTVAHASDNIGIDIQDVSDADTADNLIGKIEKCQNFGSVQADLNGGGILGVVALENDLDPEGELEIKGEVSMNLEGELRAVIIDCENSAKVIVRNQNGGGIVGWLSMGLVRNCFNTGSLEADGADYVGGIVGRSGGYIRNCNSKCEVSGKTYMGGIAGSASTVSDCRSMTQLLSGTERIGNVLGVVEDSYREEENPIQNNFYLYIGEDFGGIDGISYADMAEPLQRDEFLNLENLPEEFWKVTITFIQEDNTRQQVEINQSSALALSDIPKVKDKEGYLGSWKGLEDANLSEILFDMSFEAVYTPIKGTISSKVKDQNEKPVLLLQGSFDTTEEVALVEVNDSPAKTEEQKLVKAFGFVLQKDEMATEARFMIPEDVKGEDVVVFVKSEETDWRIAESVVEGSYVKFALKNGENQIAIMECKKAPFLWYGVAVIVAVIFVIAVGVERKLKKTEDLKEKKS